jgi:uncharacterized OB-fold protein
MTSAMATIPPEPTPLSRPFWDACREHRLIMQACQDCGELTFYPAHMCPTCGGGSLKWQELSGRGRIHSVTTVYRPAAPVFAASVPYVIALVEVAEGPIMMSNIVGPGALDAKIGASVDVVFEDLAEVTLPRFRLSGD